MNRRACQDLQPENPPAAAGAESLPSDAPVREPSASEAPPPPPPMMPAFFMGPDGRMYPRRPPTTPTPCTAGPRTPAPTRRRLKRSRPPPEDTIFQGTVTNFGHFGEGSFRHCYGFIKIDHSGNEVFVSEEDAPDGYLSQGDRCEFRIVDARTKNRRTRARQWKATDVVCIQRKLPRELRHRTKLSKSRAASWSKSKRTAARCASRTYGRNTSNAAPRAA